MKIEIYFEKANQTMYSEDLNKNWKTVYSVKNNTNMYEERIKINQSRKIIIFFF